jgi:hypothetical protein
MDSPMIVYLSGNFPQFRTNGKEEAFKKKLHAEGRKYHRLVTYFYPEDCETVLNFSRLKRRSKAANNESETVEEKQGFDDSDVLNSESIAEEAETLAEEEIEEIIDVISPKNVKQTNLF